VSNSYDKEIIGEFDSQKRIFHLTAKNKIRVMDMEQLDELCMAVQTLLKKNAGSDRCYMIVDISKIIIDPSLAEPYGRKIRQIAQSCLYPDGLARYGFQITRLTVRLSDNENNNFHQNLFSTRKEAFDYINKIIACTQSEVPRL